MAQNQASLELLLTGRYPAKPDSPTFASGVPVTVDHPLIREGRIRFFLDPTTWINHLAGYDFSFGSRIHGNIAALLAGTPALVLAHDSRTLELARYHQIPHRLITDDPDQIDAAALYAEADWEPLNTGHADRWRLFQSFLHDHGLRTVYDDGEDRGAGFDRQLAGVTFPPPVGAPVGATPEALWQLRRELTEARRELSTLRADAERDARTAAVAGRPSAMSRLLSEELLPRLSTAGRSAGQSASRPASRPAGQSVGRPAGRSRGRSAPPAVGGRLGRRLRRLGRRSGLRRLRRLPILDRLRGRLGGRLSGPATDQAAGTDSGASEDRALVR
jgi:hypothetical protein